LASYGGLKRLWNVVGCPQDITTLTALTRLPAQSKRLNWLATLPGHLL